MVIDYGKAPRPCKGTQKDGVNDDDEGGAPGGGGTQTQADGVVIMTNANDGIDDPHSCTIHQFKKQMSPNRCIDLGSIAFELQWLIQKEVNHNPLVEMCRMCQLQSRCTCSSRANVLAAAEQMRHQQSRCTCSSRANMPAAEQMY